MRIPSPISSGSEEHPFSAGGFAPWPSRRPQTPPATARTITCLVASSLFAVLVNQLAAVTSFTPVALHSHAYQSAEQPGILCDLLRMECSVMSKSVFGTKPFDWEPHPLAPKPTTFEPRSGPVLKRIEIDDPMHTANVNRALLEGASLDEGQMFAMMNMSGEYRHQAIWHYARQNIFELPPFTFGTFAELAERGYAEKPEGSRYHRLTQSASALAGAVADDLVQRHKIHAPILVHSRGEITKHVTFRCTCGYSCALTAGSNMQLKAGRAFSSHLRSVNAVSQLAEGIATATRRQGEG